MSNKKFEEYLRIYLLIIPLFVIIMCVIAYIKGDDVLYSMFISLVGLVLGCGIVMLMGLVAIDD